MASGLPSAGGFAVRETFDVSVAALTAAVFVGPQLCGLLVDAPLLVWLERCPRHRLVFWGMFAMAVAMVGCALAPDLFWFAFACALYFPASGVACGVAQAALMDAAPERRERNMGLWAAAGWIGDVAGPCLLWVCSELDFGWRSAFLVVASALVASAIGLSRHSLPAPITPPDTTEDYVSGSIWGALRLVIRQRVLMLWLGGVALCSLMDELLTVFVGIRFHAESDGVASITTSLVAFSLGGVCGLAALESVLARFSARRVLAAACWGCVVSYGGWLVNQAPALGPPLLFACGVCVAWHYPVAQAQAYRALPHRSGLVAAGTQAFAAFDLMLPLVLGSVNDVCGVNAALALFAIQPVGLLLVLKVDSRRTHDAERVDPLP